MSRNLWDLVQPAATYEVAPPWDHHAVRKPKLTSQKGNKGQHQVSRAVTQPSQNCQPGHQLSATEYVQLIPRGGGNSSNESKIKKNNKIVVVLSY